MKPTEKPPEKPGLAGCSFIAIVAVITVGGGAVPGLSSLAHAEEEAPMSNEAKAIRTLQLTSKTETTSSQFFIGIELAELKTSTVSLNGGGVHFGFEYAFNDRWSVMPSLSLVFGLSGSQGYLYSGLEGLVRYNLFGTFRHSSQEVDSDGAPVVIQTSSPEKRLSIGLGVKQLLLNGTNQLYPASGVTAQLSYTCPVFQRWLEFSGGLSELSSNSKNVTAVILNVSIPFGL